MRLAEALAAHGARQQWDIVLHWAPEAVVARHRAEIAPPPRTAPQALAEAVGAVLRAECARHEAAVLAALTPAVLAFAEGGAACADTQVAVTVLVAANAEAAVEAALDALPAEQMEGVSIDMRGPLPPLSFSAVRLATVQRPGGYPSMGNARPARSHRPVRPCTATGAWAPPPLIRTASQPSRPTAQRCPISPPPTTCCATCCRRAKPIASTACWATPGLGWSCRRMPRPERPRQTGTHERATDGGAGMTAETDQAWYVYNVLPATALAPAVRRRVAGRRRCRQCASTTLLFSPAWCRARCLTAPTRPTAPPTRTGWVRGSRRITPSMSPQRKPAPACRWRSARCSPASTCAQMADARVRQNSRGAGRRRRPGGMDVVAAAGCRRSMPPGWTITTPHCKLGRGCRCRRRGHRVPDDTPAGQGPAAARSPMLAAVATTVSSQLAAAGFSPLDEPRSAGLPNWTVLVPRPARTRTRQAARPGGGARARNYCRPDCRCICPDPGQPMPSPAPPWSRRWSMADATGLRRKAGADPRDQPARVAGGCPGQPAGHRRCRRRSTRHLSRRRRPDLRRPSRVARLDGYGVAHGARATGGEHAAGRRTGMTHRASNCLRPPRRCCASISIRSGSSRT